MWRNWQTHLTQNQAVNSRAGSSPAIGTEKRNVEINISLFYFIEKASCEIKCSAWIALRRKTILLQKLLAAGEEFCNMEFFFYKLIEFI